MRGDADQRRHARLFLAEGAAPGVRRIAPHIDLCMISPDCSSRPYTERGVILLV